MLAVGAVLLEQASGLALVLGQRQQEQLGGDELVASLLGFLVGEIEQIGQLARDVDLAAVALDLGQALDARAQGLAQRRHVDAGLGQDRGGAAILLIDQGQQQMLRLDIGIVVAHREALRVGEGLLELGREFVEAHGEVVPENRAWQYIGACRGISTTASRPRQFARGERCEHRYTLLRQPIRRRPCDPARCV